MKNKERPDNVVFNEETQSYDAALRPYATNVGAPSITTDDVHAWKTKNIGRINKLVETKFLELKAEYENMLKELQYNQLIFDAKFSFEPIVGETYHLYQRANGEMFLSIIEPTQCDFEFVGSFYLNADSIWNKVE